MHPNYGEILLFLFFSVEDVAYIDGPILQASVEFNVGLTDKNKLD